MKIPRCSGCSSALWNWDCCRCPHEDGGVRRAGRVCVQAGRERLNFGKQFSAVVSGRDACSTLETLQGCVIYRIFFLPR